jgi:protease secretion system outer membrane protein
MNTYPTSRWSFACHWVAAAGLICAAPAWAGDFERAYRAALDHDAKYQSDKFAFASGQQVAPIARAALLPQVSANITETMVSGSQTSDLAGGGSSSTSLNYRAPSQNINVRAPLINMEAQARYRQASAQVNASEANFSARKAALVDRVAMAYLQRMLAEDSFSSLQAQLRAVLGQRDLMRKRFDRGEGTKTEVAEARGTLSLVTSQWVDSKDQMENARQALMAITGQSLESIARLRTDFAPPPLEPLTQEAWQDMARRTNPDVAARKYAVEIAEAGVARSSAGHLPRLDLVASASNSRNESVSSLNQSVNQNAIGLQLSIPIFSGGAVQAGVAQAVAEKSRAEAELLAEMRALDLEVARLFQVIQTGSSKLLAYHDVLEASQIALDGTQKGQTTGLRTNADVLEAVRKVYQAQRDLAQARYDHIFQHVKLYNKAGMEPDAVVAKIDALLNPAGAAP